ncbi:MAG: hypothetical protein P8Y20_00180 [Gammaproteobacteria bacterium]
MTKYMRGIFHYHSTRHINAMMFLFVCLFCVSTFSDAEQSVDPVARLSEKSLVSSALSYKQKTFEENFEAVILDNRASLESMDIVQLRVDQSVNRILGKNNQDTHIDSQPNELLTLVKILDDGLYRFQQLEIAKAMQAKDNTQPKQTELPLYIGTVSQAAAAFWKTRGAKSADRLNRQVSKDTEKELEIYRKNRYSLDDEQAFRRDQILLLISKLKLAKIESIYDEVLMVSGTSLAPLSDLRLDGAKKITIPELSSSLDNLLGFIPNLFPESEMVEKDKFSAYLNRYAPGLNHEADPLNDIELTRWLSAGKNVAFDLYSLIDRLERARYLKENATGSQDPNTVIFAAKFLRVKLAYFSYLKQRELFSLSHCERVTSALHQAASNQLMPEDGSGAISQLFGYEQSVKNTLDYYIAYARLQSAFIYLQNSLRLPPAANAPSSSLDDQVNRLMTWNRKKQSTDVFSCYLSDRQKAQQQQAIDEIRKEKEAAISYAAELQAKLDAIAEAERKKAEAIKQAKSAWIRQQSAGKYTLLIKTAKNRQQLLNYAKKHKLGGKAHVVTTLSYGQKLFKLLYGSYQNRELAYVDQFKLPEKVQMENDIRTQRFSTIQQKLPPLQ